MTPPNCPSPTVPPQPDPELDARIAAEMNRIARETGLTCLAVGCCMPAGMTGYCWDHNPLRGKNLQDDAEEIK